MSKRRGLLLFFFLQYTMKKVLNSQQQQCDRSYDEVIFPCCVMFCRWQCFPFSLAHIHFPFKFAHIHFPITFSSREYLTTTVVKFLQRLSMQISTRKSDAEVTYEISVTPLALSLCSNIFPIYIFSKRIF